MQKLTAKQRQVLTLMRDREFILVGYKNDRGVLCFQGHENVNTRLYMTLTCRSLLNKGLIERDDKPTSFLLTKDSGFVRYKITQKGLEALGQLCSGKTQDFVETWIEENTEYLSDYCGEGVAVIEPSALREFLSGFTLIRGPFKVEDKDPEIEKTVLAFNGHIWEQCYFDGDEFLLDGDLQLVFEDVTHWMPMPDPVK